MSGLRDTPAAALMREAQSAPDRPGPARKVQFVLDEGTAAAVDWSRMGRLPAVTLNEWVREAVRQRLEREGRS